MPVPNRTMLVASGVLIAALTAGIVPQQALTQDQAPKVPTTPPPLTQAVLPIPAGKAFVYQQQPPEYGVRLVQADESSPSEHQFDDRTRELLSTYGKLNEADRPAVVEKLTTIVTEHFNFKQTSRERELAQLEEQIKKLRALHEQRAREKNEIVQDRVRQLVRDAAGMGWGSTSSGAMEFVARADRQPPQLRAVRVMPNGVVVTEQPLKENLDDANSSSSGKK